MANFIKILFGNETKGKRVLPKVGTLKVVVVEFAEYGNYGFGRGFARLLQRNTNFEVRYFDEPFDKAFLNLQGRNFFDLVDAGNTILQKLNADIVVWGYQEHENIRLNFQTANAYSDWDNVSCSVLESIYVPAEYFEHINFFPEILENIIIGIIASAISEQRIDLRHLKQKLLKSVISKFSTGPAGNNDKLMLSPYVMNTTGLIYLSYAQKELNKKAFDTIKELFNNALAYQSQIMQNVHLGCIYKNIAQLYEMALQQDLDGHWLLFRESISNYRTAQKYLDYFNYPYDFALISFKLSQLYFQYWKFSNDTQALRDAVYYLREAEKTYTQITFPELWSKIEGYLGYYLSLLGMFSKSTDISMLAIRSYKNKQIVYRKELYPVMWAKIQENIANVYYNIGKTAKDVKAFGEAVNYYKSALKIYENKKMHNEITVVNNSLDKVMQAWKG
ncbi:MAG: hypothetical protein J6W96_05245 [Alphaproteobacteria bacterium]|nr:hypothetical protein [Alphaproteobacteria bacterium]